MHNIKTIAGYTKSFSNEELHSAIIRNHMNIESWFRKQWIKYPAPFYSSIDLRNSGYKIAPVDTNLFPAGFNNLDNNLDFLYISAVQHVLERISPALTKVLIISENHTRNQFYLSSINSLSNIIRKAGYEVIVSSLLDSNGETEKLLTNKDQILSHGSFTPDVILLNNDLSDGIPEILNDIKQPILPDKNLGWTNRSKTIHFEYYTDVINNFSRLLQIDPWFIEPLFRNCGEIDFKTKQGENCLIRHASRLFTLIQEKYDQYNINEEPYIMIKADSGTYGMGIMQVRNIDELMSLNRKQRTKMLKTKGGNKVDRVILQEGIYSNEILKPTNHVAEPVIYSFGSNLVGGFYRLHDAKNNSENLNSPGMTFHPIPFKEACINPNDNETIYSDTNKFYIYGVIARLAILAASKELYNIEP
ncbi:MAG: glutamate--cysteine ligase [Gammaproteobacteria bacterium]|nr:glutamate--cysteine ligase [Gammaproteobacteria bacterium]